MSSLSAIVRSARSATSSLEREAQLNDRHKSDPRSRRRNQAPRPSYCAGSTS